jgi:hypothetical protein
MSYAEIKRKISHQLLLTHELQKAVVAGNTERMKSILQNSPELLETFNFRILLDHKLFGLLLALMQMKSFSPYYYAIASIYELTINGTGMMLFF